MKKNNDRDCCVPLLRKTIRIMKITTLFSLAVACCISASTYAQDYKVSIKKNNASIIEILKEIEKNSEFTFRSSSFPPQQFLKTKKLIPKRDEQLPVIPP